MAKKSQKKTDEIPANFETAMQKLEGLVQNLEKGELVLEESINQFEHGMQLVKFCEERLAEAEKKVKILMKDRNGEIRTEDFAARD